MAPGPWALATVMSHCSLNLNSPHTISEGGGSGFPQLVTAGVLATTLQTLNQLASLQTSI